MMQKRPEMDFSYYTPFMEGRNMLEALLEWSMSRPEDYDKNEITLERRIVYAYEAMKGKRFEFAEKMLDNFYKLLQEIYDEIKSKKPEGNYTFFIQHNWEFMLLPRENGMEFLVWMRGAWCDSKFLDKPLPTMVQNHIPKDQLRGY